MIPAFLTNQASSEADCEYPLDKTEKDRHLADCQDACLLFLSFGFSETLCDYAAVP